jgi:hypothetical protein
MGHVTRLQNIWQSREGGLKETWGDARIGRITGTTAKIVMTGKNKPSGLQLAQLFGFTTFQGTIKMQIEIILEQKILHTFCKLHKMQLKKESGGPSLRFLYQYNYVGHTPDGPTIQLRHEQRQVLEVKVVFSVQDTISALFKKHEDQLKLGLFIHQCTSGRLLVYRCNAQMMTRHAAEHHEVNVNDIEDHVFQQDKLWFAKFKPNVKAFCTQHLEWFYARTFDMEQARCKVESILDGIKEPRKMALLKRQKLVET